jgi:hypothetical protein
MLRVKLLSGDQDKKIFTSESVGAETLTQLHVLAIISKVSAQVNALRQLKLTIEENLE